MERKHKEGNQENIRLNKYLANSGVSSRRMADELIASGRVAVNGKQIKQLGMKIVPGRDRVEVDGESVKPLEKNTYILLNKPKDCITTLKDPQGRKSVMDYLPDAGRLYPVGRLDRNSTGALIITDDGELTHRLMHPRYSISKVYRVKLDKPLDSSDSRKLITGVYVDGRKAAAANVTAIPGTNRLQHIVDICEGRYRQIRRMFEVIGYKVKLLDRVNYAGLTCDGLRRGEWRFLAGKEINNLKSLVKLLSPPTRKRNGRKPAYQKGVKKEN